MKGFNEPWISGKKVAITPLKKTVFNNGWAHQNWLTWVNHLVISIEKFQFYDSGW